MATLGKILLWGLAIIGGLLVLLMVFVPDPGPGQASSGSRSSGAGSYATSHANCVELGVDYFRRIGSFPRLSDGRDARSVASERCSRTISAFNDLR